MLEFVGAAGAARHDQSPRAGKEIGLEFIQNNVALIFYGQQTGIVQIDFQRLPAKHIGISTPIPQFRIFFFDRIVVLSPGSGLEAVGVVALAVPRVHANAAGRHAVDRDVNSFVIGTSVLQLISLPRIETDRDSGSGTGFGHSRMTEGPQIAIEQRIVRSGVTDRKAVRRATGRTVAGADIARQGERLNQLAVVDIRKNDRRGLTSQGVSDDQELSVVTGSEVIGRLAPDLARRLRFQRVRHHRIFLEIKSSLSGVQENDPER